jgi:hypothetical protein
MLLAAGGWAVNVGTSKAVIHAGGSSNADGQGNHDHRQESKHGDAAEGGGDAGFEGLIHDDDPTVKRSCTVHSSHSPNAQNSTAEVVCLRAKNRRVAWIKTAIVPSCLLERLVNLDHRQAGDVGRGMQGSDIDPRAIRDPCLRPVGLGPNRAGDDNYRDGGDCERMEASGHHGGLLGSRAGRD